MNPAVPPALSYKGWGHHSSSCITAILILHNTSAALWREWQESAGVGIRWVVRKMQDATDVYGAKYGSRYGFWDRAVTCNVSCTFLFSDTRWILITKEMIKDQTLNV